MSGLNLGCPVTSIRYNFDKNSGDVQVPEGMCTDMSSVIAYFKKIDPSVVHITTWCENELDTQYVLHSDGEWAAI
jgi:hypothetical protein